MSELTRLKPNIIVPLRALWFECQCGHREFAISGFQQGNALKIHSVTCTRKGCNRKYQVDKKGDLGGFVNQGKLTKILHKGKEFENG